MTISNIVDTLNNTFDSTNIPANILPPLLLKCISLQRPGLSAYKIAAEIDSMFNDKHLTGIGKLEFLGANQMILTDEYAGLCVMYQAIHGDEDKTKMPNPND